MRYLKYHEKFGNNQHTDDIQHTEDMEVYETSVLSEEDRTQRKTYMEEHIEEDEPTKEIEKKQPESQEEIQARKSK